MSKKSLYKYYVAYFVYGSNEILFVTSVNYAEKTWYAKRGEPALAMKMYEADDLMFGMTANFCPAFVVKAPSYMDIINLEDAIGSCSGKENENED